MTPLPSLMLAPNGARRSKADHPNLPLSITETVVATRAAVAVGADGLHLHVRDSEGRHTLDAGLYGEALSALAETCPGLPVQITTEAAGRYSPDQQIALVDDLAPNLVSVALREILSDGDRLRAHAAFLRWDERSIAVQHILYSPSDLDNLIALIGAKNAARSQLLFVLGRYAPSGEAVPTDLDGFLPTLRSLPSTPDWAICAFGAQETRCLVAAHRLGGKLRVGFENNFFDASGETAPDNASRVVDVVRALHLQAAEPLA